MDDIEPYDTIQADQIEIGDQVVICDDHIEVTDISDVEDSVIITGYSHNEGDNMTYELHYSISVDLWSV